MASVKHKSKKSVTKRIRVTKNSMKFRHSGRNHINGKMTSKLKRNLRNTGRYISEHFIKQLREMI
ncbi:MAG: 50S ribosomal protein L35 [Legionellales bacterium]|nr:50S ribosomal protein L35 [Legionellales bacterium]